VYAKFGDDRLWNEKALADRKSDNNNTTTTNNKNKNKNKNNVGGYWGPVPGSKNSMHWWIFQSWTRSSHRLHESMLYWRLVPSLLPSSITPDGGNKFTWHIICTRNIWGYMLKIHAKFSWTPDRLTLFDKSLPHQHVNKLTNKRTYWPTNTSDHNTSW